MNNYPNQVQLGSNLKQTIEITFQVYDYKKIMQVELGGNCMGVDMMEHAVDAVFEKLPVNSYGDTFIELTNDESSLVCENDEQRDEQWLRKKVVAIAIISIA